MLKTFNPLLSLRNSIPLEDLWGVYVFQSSSEFKGNKLFIRYIMPNFQSSSEFKIFYLLHYHKAINTFNPLLSLSKYDEAFETFYIELFQSSSEFKVIVMKVKKISKNFQSSSEFKIRTHIPAEHLRILFQSSSEFKT